MKRLYYYRFNVYIREGVDHSHTKSSHTQSTNQTSDTPFKSHLPSLTFKQKKEEKTQPKVQFIYKEGLVSAESSPSENLEGSIHIGVFSSQTNIQNNHKQNIFGSK